ncbi:hypothetical protein ABW19_dt0209797 [Dactylella cylindrospora]|nr:hypothetical protein ABW19_dt0209797 [Dactylella cylindrospora]
MSTTPKPQTESRRTSISEIRKRFEIKDEANTPRRPPRIPVRTSPTTGKSWAPVSTPRLDKGGFSSLPRLNGSKLPVKPRPIPVTSRNSVPNATKTTVNDPYKRYHNSEEKVIVVSGGAYSASTRNSRQSEAASLLSAATTAVELEANSETGNQHKQEVEKTPEHEVDPESVPLPDSEEPSEAPLEAFEMAHMDGEWEPIPKSAGTPSDCSIIDADEDIFSSEASYILTPDTAEDALRELARAVQSCPRSIVAPTPFRPRIETSNLEHPHEEYYDQLASSTSSFDSIWPADIDSIETRRHKNPNFLPPPARETERGSDANLSGTDKAQEGSNGRLSYKISQDHDCIIALSYQNAIFEYHVSRNVLSHASPILKKILSDTSKQANGKLWLTEFPGNPDAILKVFEIIHHSADGEMLDVDFSELREFAKVCEGYQLGKALRPWSHIWLQKHAPEALDRGNEDWLYISKVFGSEEQVQNLISRLSNECSTDEEIANKIPRGYYAPKTTKSQQDGRQPTVASSKVSHCA